ncbi:MAG: hypothetical protein F8N36_14510 [Desulfovibrio sp.]|uniref:hypothetical protein n=1 Tax=Desulfovibrio sp. TaxID=885 RepID=UPI00135DC8E9|nr:hypothetical protein [Desulfovibrio sp.]MTJ94050.1 hypothetical protein [Desulfovibrio sp.]
MRCSCGYYEVRRGKVLRDPAYGAPAACSVCDYEREMLAGRATPPPIRHERIEEKVVARDDAAPPPMLRLFQMVLMHRDSMFGELSGPCSTQWSHAECRSSARTAGISQGH